jgi:CRP/FNR family transcriptional regulator, cyclic AMP receptor protein
MPSEVLALTATMPAHQLAAGDVLYGQGEDSDTSIAVLVDGALAVELGDLTLSRIDQPGSFVGEVGALLGTARTARVVAVEPSTVRSIGDPEALFASHPELALELARQLAGRLHRLLAYLGDVRAQYAGEDGHLSMIDSVLGKLATRAPVDIEPGSDRSPDY